MKKSIAFLLASLAATSSLLFHTQQAKAKVKKCKSSIPIEIELIKQERGFVLRSKNLNSPIIRSLQREGFIFKNKKEAVEIFKDLCKGKIK